LSWLADASTDTDPLDSAADRQWAVHDYHTYLKAALKRNPATINNALPAVDDLYTRRGLGTSKAARVEVPATAPRALGERVHCLRAVKAFPSPRDQALALVPFYAGARIAETVAIDLADVRLALVARGSRPQLVERLPQPSGQLPHVGDLLAVGDDPEVEVPAVAHHRDVEPHPVGDHGHGVDGLHARAHAVERDLRPGHVRDDLEH
jgi:hypothetical protein